MTYNITLTPSSGTPTGAGWDVLKYYLSSSSDLRQLLRVYDPPEELGASGVNITKVTIHGYVRNGQNYNKDLRHGFRPSADSGVSTWATLDGTTVLGSSFRAIDRNSGSTMVYKEIETVYTGDHIFAKWIQNQCALGNPLYLAVIQPESMSLSVNTDLKWYNIDVEYELLGNIPTTDKTTAKLGETVTTTINRIIADSTTTLNYKIGETVIASENIGTATSHTFTIPDSAGACFPTSATSTLTVEAVTSQSGTEFGTLSTNVTLTLPEDASPTASLTYSRIWQSTVATASQISAYVQKQSGVSATAKGSPKYGASIAGVTLQAESKSYTATTASATFKHLPFENSGNITLTAIVTDSRGNTGTVSKTVTVLPWSAPTIQAFTIQRATETGTIAIDGTCAYANATASVSSLQVSGAEQNKLYFAVKYREIGEESWTATDTITGAGTAATFEGLLQSNGAIVDTFNDMSGYEFRVEISDLYATSAALDQMPTKEQFWDVDETTGKMGFGGDAPTETESIGYRFHKPVECTEITVNNRRFGWYAGDTFTFSAGTLAGSITGGGTALYTTLPMGMPIFANAVTVTGSFTARGDKGYVNNGAIAFPTSAITVTATIACAEIGLIQILLNRTSAFSNVTNNRPISVYVETLTITFS